MNPPFVAVVLAGGGGRRLGGVDKPELVVGGRRLLDRVLAAVPDAAARIVVGPARAVPAGVVVTREDPPGGGPLAALAVALPNVTTDRMVLLAGDLPFLTGDVVAALLAAAEGRDGALLVDDNNRDQLLLGAWSTAHLRAAVAAVTEPAGAPLGRVLRALDPVRLRWPTPAGTPPPWWDCDEPADLQRARMWLPDAAVAHPAPLVAGGPSGGERRRIDTAATPADPPPGGARFDPPAGRRRTAPDPGR